MSSSKHTATEQEPLPWFTESYFTSEPATAAARKIYIKILASRGVIIIVFLLSVLSIYWGALWQTPVHVHNLNCWVVVSSISHDSRDVLATRCATLMYAMFMPLPLQDFDGGEVGQFVSRAVVASSGVPTKLTWSAVPTDLFPNGAPDLQSAVIQEKAWAIIAGASRHIRFIS